MRPEQSSSIKFLLLWLYFVEFPDSIAHVHRRNARTAKTKTLFFLRHFCKSSATIFAQTIRKEVSPKGQNVSFRISFQEHKSVKTVRERSILAVLVAKYGPLRERSIKRTLGKVPRVSA